MKIVALGIFAMIGFFLWKMFSDGGAEVERNPSSDNDHSFLNADSGSSGLLDDDSSSSSMLSEDNPARGMWDVTSVYYNMMHSDCGSSFDDHSVNNSIDDSWSSSSSFSNNDD